MPINNPSVILGPGNDYYLGDNNNDTIYGLGGDDTLKGAGGNDALYGGTGNDSMYGGAGNDSYYVEDAGDKVIEGVGAGTDVVYSMLGEYVLPANVENLVLVELAGAATGQGNNLNNFL